MGGGSKKNRPQGGRRASLRSDQGSGQPANDPSERRLTPRRQPLNLDADEASDINTEEAAPAPSCSSTVVVNPNPATSPAQAAGNISSSRGREEHKDDDTPRVRSRSQRGSMNPEHTPVTMEDCQDESSSSEPHTPPKEGKIMEESHSITSELAGPSYSTVSSGLLDDSVITGTSGALRCRWTHDGPSQ